jgi:hypothetical protein
MSKSIRFLGMAILAWAGVRAVSLGIVPGAEALAFDPPSPRPAVELPPVAPSFLPAIEPLPSGQQFSQPPPGGVPYASYPSPGYYASIAPFPIYVPVPASASARSAPPQIVYLSPPDANPREVHIDGAGFAGAPTANQLAQTIPAARHQFTPSFEAPRRMPGLDRLSLSGWALMRNEPGPDSLANSGMLGGSEAGARLIWRFSPHIAASVRTSAPINSQRGVEASVGLRYQPLQSLPVAVTLERRHGFKDYGRNAFAAFAEGGVYGYRLPWNTAMDGYFQAGVVDFNNPDWFMDGQLAVSRPVWRNMSAGFGAWGGAQPGLRRFDVGPRLSLNLRRGMRAHADYRLNVAGNAQPGSGATVTLAGDF